MPTFSSNDPREFGWTAPPSQVVPFSFRGQSFPQGVHPLAVPTFTEALRRLVDVGGLVLHPGPATTSGDWGYEDRNIRGSATSKSFHAYAIAIDVNAPWNPLGVADPPAGPYRLANNTDALVRPLGILWGGAREFGSRPDRMHLEVHCSPSELRAGYGLQPAPAGRPYPLPAGYWFGPQGGGGRQVSGYGTEHARWGQTIAGAQAALRVGADGFYGPVTTQAVRHLQTTNALQVDGLLGPNSWRALYGS